MNIKNNAKDMGKRALAETYLQFNYDDVLQQARVFLKAIKAETIKGLIADGMAPPIDEQEIKKAKGWEDFIGDIQVARFYEVLHDARPDVAEAMAQCGDDGVDYILRLKAYVLEVITDHPTRSLKPYCAGSAPAPAAPAAPAAPPPVELLRATCEDCGESWPVPKNLIDKIKVCPFCGKDKTA